MTGQRRVLLTPGEMGPAEWVEVSQRLTGSGHHVLLDTELTYDRGIMSAAGSQLERLRDPRFWTQHGVDHVDLAVGFGVGAGPAATMVAEGRATSVVLIDPDLTMLAMTRPDDLDVLTYEAASDLAAEMAERLEPFSDNLRHGPFTREMVDILCGAFTGQAWRTKRADLVAPFCMSRITIDRSQRPTEADQHASGWASLAARTSISVWLTAANEPLARYLRTYGLDVTLHAWSQAPWIRSAEELAAAIQNQVDKIETEHAEDQL